MKTHVKLAINNNVNVGKSLGIGLFTKFIGGYEIGQASSFL